MTGPIASLPMYDADRASVEAWWRGISRALRAEGMSRVPSSLDWPVDLDVHWRDSRLLLSQTCGYPLVTTLRDDVQVVGAFRYRAPGCFGIYYRSELIARIDDAGAIEDYRGRVAAVNSLDSHSGANALRAMVAPLAVDGAFFNDWVVSGSHRRSLEALQSSKADIAAIDCITLAGLRRHAPESLRGLRVIGQTAAAPGLPLIAAALATAVDLQALRSALSSACMDPTLTDVREALFIDGFEIVAASEWQVI
jgi:ABC-type phosphate/phosphonate transport system substrate-binding protein